MFWGKKFTPRKCWYSEVYSMKQDSWKQNLISLTVVDIFGHKKHNWHQWWQWPSIDLRNIFSISHLERCPGPGVGSPWGKWCDIDIDTKLISNNININIIDYRLNIKTAAVLIVQWLLYIHQRKNVLKVWSQGRIFLKICLPSFT